VLCALEFVLRLVLEVVLDVDFELVEFVSVSILMNFYLIGAVKLARVLKTEIFTDEHQSHFTRIYKKAEENLH